MTGRLIEYLGQGLVANRPVTPDIADDTLALYYATDELIVYGWNRATAAWNFVGGPDSAHDGMYYLRLNGAWAVLPNYPDVPDVPGSDGFVYGIKNGVWFVVPTPASALNDLTDVDTVTDAPTNGQVLTWNTAESVWEPASIPGGGTPTQRAARIWRLYMGIANRALTTNLVGFGEVEWRDAGGTLLTGGSGFAYSDSDYNPGLSASHAFNGSTSGDGWLSAQDGRLGRSWLAYDFTTPVTPVTLKLAVEVDYNPSFPVEVTHQFSVDGGVEWVTTDVFLPAAGVDNVYQSFTISPV